MKNSQKPAKVILSDMDVLYLFMLHSHGNVDNKFQHSILNISRENHIYGLTLPVINKDANIYLVEKHKKIKRQHTFLSQNYEMDVLTFKS